MDFNKVRHRRAVTTCVLKDSEFLLIEVLAPSRDAQIRNGFARHRMQTSLLTYFKAIYMMILRLFSHRRYRKKGIVYIGDTGGLLTGAGENLATKHGGRSPHGFRIQKRERASQAKGASQGGGPMPTPDLHHT